MELYSFCIAQQIFEEKSEIKNQNAIDFKKDYAMFREIF